MTDASRPAAGDSSGSDGTPPRAPNRHLTADEIAAGLPAGDSGAPRVNNEWVDNYAGREAEGTGRRSVERDLARDLRDCRAQLAAVTAERDEARISSAEAWNNFADADSVRHVTAMRAERDALAADVERLTAERNEANAHATACSKALTYETDEANELRAQLDAAESRLLAHHEEDELADQISMRMSEILCATANALKGQPKPLCGHDWSDLPEVAGALAADVKRLEEERDAKQAQLVLEILDRQEFEGRWLQAAADVKKLRAAVQLALNAFEHNWCINWDDLARVLTETEATHTERGDAHEATRDGMRLHRVPSQGGYVATGDGASVQHASSEAPRVDRVTPQGRIVYDVESVLNSTEGRKHLDSLRASSSLSMDEAACRIRDYAEQIEANDRLRSMSLSVERTLELESQLAALRAAAHAHLHEGECDPEMCCGERGADGTYSSGPCQACARDQARETTLDQVLADTRAAATAHDAALREEGRRIEREHVIALEGSGIPVDSVDASMNYTGELVARKMAAMFERGRRQGLEQLKQEALFAWGEDGEGPHPVVDMIDRALLATPAPPEGK